MKTDEKALEIIEYISKEIDSFESTLSNKDIFRKNKFEMELLNYVDETYNQNVRERAIEEIERVIEMHSTFVKLSDIKAHQQSF